MDTGENTQTAAGEEGGVGDAAMDREHALSDAVSTSTTHDQSEHHNHANNKPVIEDEPELDNDVLTEMLVGSPMKGGHDGRKSPEEYFDNFDNAVTTSLLDVSAGPLSADEPCISHQHKSRPAMKMFLPFRLNKPTKDTMPLPYAGLFSTMTFHWMSSYMWGIYRKGIDNMPTWSCPPQESCAANVTRFEKGWLRELEERGEEKSSLARVIRKLFAKRLLVSFIALFITMVLSFIGPAMLLRWLLEYLTSPNIVISYGIVLVIGLSIAEFSRSVFMAVWWFINYQMAIRVRAGILSLLFRKVMRLRSTKGTSIGELINVCTSDGQRVFDGVCMVPFLPSIIFVLLFGLIYTAILIGPWALVGMLTFLLFFPVMISVSRVTMRYRQTAVNITDQRVHLMTELLNYIKFIKMYAWETFFYQQIKDVRTSEQKLLEKAAFTQSVSVSSSPYIPIVSVAVTFIGHTMSGNDLTAAQAFTMLAVLNTLRFSVGILPYCIKAFAEVVVSFRRIKKILLMDELMTQTMTISSEKHAVEILECSARWDSSDTTTTSDKDTGNVCADRAGNGVGDETGLLTVSDTQNSDQNPGLVNVNFTALKGQLIGVCGSVGSGKSSLLSLIMGKMRCLSGSVALCGSVGYAAQQAWIMNTTVRDNILFGRPFNHAKYQAAVDACCLQSDFNDFVAGDMTEIGERGVNLSGGQKQRISLARAVYSDCDIVLLDDPLSAVDVHVGRHIFSECVLKALAHRTVVFVTHQLQYMSYCDHVVLMKEGKLSESGSHQELMEAGNEYASLLSLHHSQHTHEAARPIITQCNQDDVYLTLEKQLSVSSMANSEKEDKDGQLVEEETSDGEVKWATYFSYMKQAGSPLILFVLCVVFVLAIGVQTYTNWFLAYWINQGGGNTTVLVGNETFVSHSLADNPDLNFYTSIFGSLILIIFISSVIRGIFFMKLTLRAATNLHDQVLHKIMRSPMSFFDTTPSGRILNRFSKDMDEIDVFLPFRLETFLQNILLIISCLLIIAIVSPWFVIAFVPLAALFLVLNHIFMTAVRAIKCEDNKTRSPFISHLGASINGIATIQAYAKTHDFILKFDELLDANSVPFLMFNLSSRWLAVRLDILCVLLTAITGVLTVVTHEYITPAMAGLSLSFAIQMTGMFQYTIRMAVETEARFTSVERIHMYLKNLTSEAATETKEDQKPDSSWPAEGRIEFSDYRMKYRSNLPTVLKGLDIVVKAGEKVGVVGRTGAGKSSLGVALFRLVEAHSGSITIDGVNIADIGLHDLRSRISIIPQDPVLFTATLRGNLDPFYKHTDDDIWKSLERCHIKEKVVSLPEQLETGVGGSGESFSVGECQLLCMARALLRGTKVILLDEATATIDTETDSLIQATLKDCFSECTIITIAHRLNTVLSCDRILVMLDGKVVEFDSPTALKENTNSAFKKMLDVVDTRNLVLK